MRWLLLAVSLSCMSLPAILVRFAEAAIEPLGFWRALIAAAVLAPLAKRGSLKTLKPALAAGGFFFIHLWLFTYAARHTRVANCMLAFSIHPLSTALAARLFYGERLRPRLLVSFALAAAGLWILAAGSRDGIDSLRGDLAALGSAAAFSFYVLAGRAARRNLDSWTFACAVNTAAAALFLTLGLARAQTFTGYSTHGWLAIAGLGLGVTLGGHALFTHLYAELDVHLLSLAKLIEPPAAAIIAVFVFGEALTGRAVLALLLIGTAIAYGASAKGSGSAPRA